MTQALLSAANEENDGDFDVVSWMLYNCTWASFLRNGSGQKNLWPLEVVSCGQALLRGYLAKLSARNISVKTALESMPEDIEVPDCTDVNMARHALGLDLEELADMALDAIEGGQ